MNIYKGTRIKAGRTVFTVDHFCADKQGQIYAMCHNGTGQLTKYWLSEIHSDLYTGAAAIVGAWGKTVNYEE